MYTLIVLTALTGWSYDGFNSDPGLGAVEVGQGEEARVYPEPLILPPPPAPPDEIPPPVVPPPAPPAEAVPPPVVNAPPVKPTYPPPAPTLWRLADASGQVWEHTDRDWLVRWVGSRNLAIRPVSSPAALGFAPTYPAAGTCSTGRCPRGR